MSNFITERKILYIVPGPILRMSIYNFLEYLQLTSGSIHLIDNSFWRGLKREEILNYNTALSEYACILKETIQEVDDSTNQRLKQDFTYKEDLLLNLREIDSNATFSNFCLYGDSHDKLITSSAKYYDGIIDTKDQNDIVINACMLGVECGVPILPEEEEIINNEGEEGLIDQYILKLYEKINKLSS